MMIRFSKDIIGLYTYPESLSELSLENCIKTGAYSILIGNQNNNYSIDKHVDPVVIDALQQHLAHFPMHIFCQTPKMYNLCGSTKFLAWNGNVAQDTQTTETIRILEENIRAVSKLDGLTVIAPGFFRHEGMGRDACIKSLQKINFDPTRKQQLVLCNLYPTLKFPLGKTLSDMCAIYQGCPVAIREHLGIGLNLAFFFTHELFAVGTEEGVGALFDEYDRAFGEVNLSFVLFEDYCQNSQKACCIGKGDIHYDLGAIGKILRRCYSGRTPLITHCEKDIDFLLSLQIN
jgi:hypothetical protein